MSIISNIIKEHVVDPALRAQSVTMMCLVSSIDRTSGVVSVKPVSAPSESQETEGTVTDERIDDISILNSKSMKDENPEEGDYIYLSFIDNELTSAVMIALIKKADANQDSTGKTLEPSEATKAAEANYSVNDNLQKALGTGGGIFFEGERSPGVGTSSWSPSGGGHTTFDEGANSSGPNFIPVPVKSSGS